MSPKQEATAADEFPAVPAPCVCNRVGIAYRLINQFYAKAFEGLDITNEQVSLLIMLWRRGPFTQRGVAKALGMDKSTISRNVKKLAEKKWVRAEKAEGSKDILLHLAPGGKKKLEKVLPRWHQKQHEAEKLLGESVLNSLNQIIIALKNAE